MTQANDTTGAVRNIRRTGGVGSGAAVSAAVVSGAWECQADAGWFPYDPPVQRTLTTAAQSHQALVNGVRGRGQVYTIDLAQMTQTNMATGVSRSIRCGPTGTGPFGAPSGG
eukprot:CAMPEP_0172586298 /NCGR_PEP_ID=MMETSP1068-20121228/5672_1 /TAXON_ID=35684 /ORGANISM="Pseudopedinella elastica, Strain CCMP716" /LENGTH=111 /DNA_ID=CAMNT_0013381047 /DNA_START=78 /DNA_END=409 /DNA_ORIENTATION=+